MLDGDRSTTNPSLLIRVGRDLSDRDAWEAFVDRYAPKVYGWCRGWGLQQVDAEDVTQNVLLKLARQMNRFQYDPARGFRGWLRVVTENVWRDWAAERRAKSESAASEDWLLDIKARDDLTLRLEREFDLELLEEASSRVQSRIHRKTWEAYHLTAVEGLSGSEVADRLGVNPQSVYMAKRNVLLMLREEVARLDRADPGP